MEINPVVRTKIVDAIERLYEQSGRTKLPTVDAVRKESRSNMNDASSLMREWRQKIRAASAGATIEVPDRLQQMSSAALADIWKHAQQLANEAAQKDAEQRQDKDREEWERLREEMSATNKNLEAENIALQERAAAAEAQAAKLVADTQQQRIDAERQLAALAEQVRSAAARAEEIEKRAESLKTALDDAIQSKRSQQAELEAIRTRLDATAAELAAAKARDAAQDAAHLEQARRLKVAEAQAAARAEALSAAREQAAHLGGQCDALRTQHAALLQKLQPAKPVKPLKVPSPARKK